MENAIDQGKNVILGSFCVLVQPLPQHIMPCKYWTKLRFATSEQHLWLPRAFTGPEIKLLRVWQVFWKHPLTSPSLFSCPGKPELVHNGQEWQHSSLPYKELFFFNVWVHVYVCVCIFNRAAVSLCRSCHWWGEARAVTQHFAEHEGPAQVPWGRTSPTVPHHPPRVVPCRVPWPQGVRGKWVPWEAVGAPGFSFGVTGAVKAIQVVWGYWSVPCGDLTLMAVAVMLRRRGWCLHPALPPSSVWACC